MWCVSPALISIVRGRSSKSATSDARPHNTSTDRDIRTCLTMRAITPRGTAPGGRG